ncbi:MAG: hypothetical protein RMJ84_09810 [Sandaracinaceae bacterium]|nr:hypothetical protein [Sandaracinaceae bacterium]
MSKLEEKGIKEKRGVLMGALLKTTRRGARRQSSVHDEREEHLKVNELEEQGNAHCTGPQDIVFDSCQALNEAKNIAIVQSDPVTQSRWVRALSQHGRRVVATASPAALLALIGEWEPDLVLLGQEGSLPQNQELVRAIRAQRPEVPIFFIGAKEARSHQVGPWAGPLGLVLPSTGFAWLIELGELMCAAA